jgi:hypothetical protein
MMIDAAPDMIDALQVSIRLLKDSEGVNNDVLRYIQGVIDRAKGEGKHQYD